MNILKATKHLKWLSSINIKRSDHQGIPMVRTRCFAWVGTAGGKHGIETIIYLGVESASNELDKLSRRLATKSSLP